MLGLWLALLIAGAAPAAAKRPPGPDFDGEALQVSLLTFAPGEIYWQRFGHNALLVRNTETGAAVVFNYGIFDFHQKNFFLNFARGRMVYRLDTDSFEHTLRQYRAEGRWVVEQRLALTPTRRRDLARFLTWNARPENAEYRYDYFRDNCSTRVRDALDAALDGALRRALEPVAAGVSYRYEAVRLMSPVPLLAVGMDAALGPAAHAPIDVWQGGFVPMTLMEAVREVQVVDASGAPGPLVAEERRLVDSTRPEAPRVPPDWLWPFTGAGLALALALALSASQRKAAWARLSFAAVASLFSLACGLAGVVLAALWGLTEHWATWRNPHLLLLNPLCLLLLPGWLASAGRRWRPGAFQRFVSRLVALLVCLAPLYLIDSRTGPPLLPWMGLLIPAHVALAIAVSRGRW